MSSAPTQLKINWTKPRANEDAMGIERSRWEGARQRVRRDVGVQGVHALLATELGSGDGQERGCKNRSGFGEVERRRFSLSKQALPVGLWEPSAGTRERIGREAAHRRFPRGGARSQTGRTAITTICPRWQTGQSRRDLPVSFS